MQPLRVAVVAPDASHRAELRTILESVGHTVYEADDRESALKAVEEIRPEAFLMEADLAAGKEAEEQPLAERVTGPIVLLTEEQRHAAADVDRLNRVGAFATLTRPWRTTEILLTLSVATQRFRDLRECYDSVNRLQTRLSDRVIVERAKGFLMRTENLSEEDAYRRIHYTARSANRTMRAVAEEILAQAAGTVSNRSASGGGGDAAAAELPQDA